jgi:hypothetical protein
VLEVRRDVTDQFVTAEESPTFDVKEPRISEYKIASGIETLSSPINGLIVRGGSHAGGLPGNVVSGTKEQVKEVEGIVGVGPQNMRIPRVPRFPRSEYLFPR